MEILTGGRQSGQNLYNALKLYNYINTLPNDTIVRVLKKDGILALCVDKSISKDKVKDKIKNNKEIIDKTNDGNLIQVLKQENEELKEDLKYVLNQTLGAFEKNWCIDWNFTEIREKYNLESE